MSFSKTPIFICKVSRQHARALFLVVGVSVGENLILRVVLETSPDYFEHGVEPRLFLEPYSRQALCYDF